MREFKYIRRLVFKEWLPLIAVFLIVAIATAIITSSSHNYYNTDLFPVTNFVWPASVFAVVMPFFVFSYRFSRVGGDTYYQLPFKEKRFKNLRVLTGLCALISVLIIAFIIGYVTFLVTYMTKPDHITYSGYYSQTFYKVKIAPAYMLIAFPISIVFIAGVYFVNTAVVSLMNRLPSAVIAVIVAQCLLNFLLPAFGGYLEHYFVDAIETVDFAARSLTLSPGLVGGNAFVSEFGLGKSFSPGGSVNNMFDIIEIDMVNGQYERLVQTIILLVIDVLIYAAAGVLTMLSPEPSGEYNGTSGARKPYQNYLLYILSIEMALILSTLASNSPFIFALLVVLYTAGLYVFMSIYLGTFKVGLINGLFIGGSGLLLVIFPIISSMISAALYASGI